jgi:hypothetical protein
MVYDRGEAGRSFSAMDVAAVSLSRYFVVSTCGCKHHYRLSALRVECFTLVNFIGRSEKAVLNGRVTRVESAPTIGEFQRPSWEAALALQRDLDDHAAHAVPLPKGERQNVPKIRTGR